MPITALPRTSLPFLLLLLPPPFSFTLFKIRLSIEILTHTIAIRD